MYAPRGVENRTGTNRSNDDVRPDEQPYAGYTVPYKYSHIIDYY